ncbi:MAG: hypothetical protein Q7J08_00145 [Methanocorpusculum sp.]|nr:hypothetical protein [Methanocorpusculum sp.]MDO9522116.1 hypothetical protein [Methanocorpusculum sp.]
MDTEDVCEVQIVRTDSAFIFVDTVSKSPQYVIVILFTYGKYIRHTII